MDEEKLKTPEMLQAEINTLLNNQIKRLNLMQMINSLTIIACCIMGVMNSCTIYKHGNIQIQRDREQDIAIDYMIGRELKEFGGKHNIKVLTAPMPVEMEE